MKENIIGYGRRGNSCPPGRGPFSGSTIGRRREWAPSYKRATVMQASLAILGVACSVAAWLAGASSRYLLAGVILGLVVPFTLIVIRPTNTRLLALDPKRDPALAEALLARWNKLHLVRSALSALALVLFLWRL